MQKPDSALDSDSTKGIIKQLASLPPAPVSLLAPGSIANAPISNVKVIGTKMFVGGQHTHTSYSPSISASELQVALRENYQQTEKLIRRIFPNLPKLPIEECFINLAIIDNQGQAQNVLPIENPSAKTQSELHEEYEAMAGVEQQKIIKPYELLNLKPSANGVARILVVGAAGTGKSTFAQYLAYAWSSPEEKMWRDEVDFLFKIKLRNLSLPEHFTSYGLADIIAKECFVRESKDHTKLVIKALTSILNYKTKKILFVLDGYDEFDQKAAAAKAVLRLFETDSPYGLIVTTRPFTNIYTYTYCHNLRCHGFIRDAITQFVKLPAVKLNGETQNSILKFMKQHQAVSKLMQIPILLDMLCAGWDTELEAHIGKMTMTKLYTHFVKKLWKNYGENRGESRTDLNAYVLENIEKDTNNFLQLLAFTATKNGKIFIPKSLVKEVLIQLYPDITESTIEMRLSRLLDAGFLYSPDNENYHFPHLSFQEYFVAKYLGQLPKDSLLAELAKHVADKDYELILSFTAGLIAMHQDRSKIDAYIEYFLERCGHSDLESRQRFLLLVRCLEEAQYTDSAAGKQKVEDTVFKYVSSVLLFEDYHQVSVGEVKALIYYLRQYPSCRKNLQLDLKLHEKNQACNIEFVKEQTEANLLALDGIQVLIKQFKESLVETKACSLLDSIQQMVYTKDEIMELANLLIDYLKNPSHLLLNIYDENNKLAPKLIALLIFLAKENPDVLAMYEREARMIGSHTLFIARVLQSGFDKSLDQNVIISAHEYNLKQDQKIIRIYALKTLIALGRADDQIIDKSLRDDSYEVRQIAAEEAMKSNPLSVIIVDAFIRNISEGTSAIKLKAIKCMLSLKINADIRFVNILIAQLVDADQDIKELSLDSLICLARNAINIRLITSAFDKNESATLKRIAVEKSIRGKEISDKINVLLQLLNCIKITATVLCERIYESHRLVCESEVIDHHSNSHLGTYRLNKSGYAKINLSIFAEAHKDFDVVLTRQNDNIAAMSGKATAFLFENKLSQAKELFSAIIETASYQDKAAQMKAYASLGLNLIDWFSNNSYHFVGKAITAYSECSEYSDKVRTVCEFMAKFFIQCIEKQRLPLVGDRIKNAFLEIVECFNRLLKETSYHNRNNDYSKVLFYYGKLFLILDEPAKAEQVFHKSLSLTSTLGAGTNLSMLLYESNLSLADAVQKFFSSKKDEVESNSHSPSM